MRRAIPWTMALLLGLGAAAARAQEHGESVEKTQERVEHAVEEHSGQSVEGHGANDHAEAGHDTAGHEVVPWYKNMDLWKFINLAAMGYIAMRMGAGAIGGVLRQRSATIRTELDEARASLEGAEKRLDDAEYRLARLHDELEQMRQDGVRNAQADKERIVQDAQAAAEEMRRKTQTQLQLELQQAKGELRQYMAKLIVERVREDLQRKVQTRGDAPFVDSVLQKVEALS